MARKPKEFDFDVLPNMTREQQVSVVQVLSKRANERLRALSKANIDYGAQRKAAYWLKKEDRQFFYTGEKFTDLKLKTQLNVLKEFLSSPTSTLTGIKEGVNKRIKTFEEKGLVIKDPKTFFAFLGSQQFKSLSKIVDSDQLVEDFSQAIDDGYNAAEIQQQYEDFLTSEMTFEQVQERRAGANLMQ